MASLREELEQVKRQLAEALAAKDAAAQPMRITFRITDGHVTRDPKTGREKPTTTGAVSIYGLQRFPITLYAAQWERLASILDGRLLGRAKGSGVEMTLTEFMTINAALLSRRES